MPSPQRTPTPKPTGGGRAATRSGSPPYCPNAGDFIWIDLDPTRGHEQRGRRPALVLSPRAYNERTGLCIACPITNRVKDYPFEARITEGSAVTGAVLADQLRALSWTARNAEHGGTAPHNVVEEVREKTAALIEIA